MFYFLFGVLAVILILSGSHLAELNGWFHVLLFIGGMMIGHLIVKANEAVH